MPRLKDAPLGKDLFRLFKFRKSPNHIHIEVKTFKIYRAPPYKAISYCWGEETDGTAMIACNDEPMEVWINLYSVLQRLSKEDTNGEFWYWNDALCIEQGNDDAAITEKARQIAMMEDIFTLAKPVLVWLGNASEAEEQAFQQLAHICEGLSKDGLSIRDTTRLPDRKDGIWLYWSQVIVRSWFTRLWIVQEGLVSDGQVVVLLGARAQITWISFHDIVSRTGSIDWLSEPLDYNKLDDRAKQAVDRDFYLEWNTVLVDHGTSNRGRNCDEALRSCVFRNLVNLTEMLHLERYHDEEFGFLQQILKVFGNRKCTYDQDRPNAMRGLLPDRLKKGLKVYGISTDIQVEYQEVSRVWLTNDPTISLFQSIRPRRKFMSNNHKRSATKLNIPSWALDLGRVVTQALGDGIPNRTDGFHAGLVRHATLRGKTEWVVPEIDLVSRLKGLKHVKFSDDSHCHVSGVVVGEVVASVLSYHEPVSETTLIDKIAPEDPRFVQWLEDSLNMIKQTGIDHDKAKEIHWRSLILNQTYAPDPEVTTMFDVEDRHSRQRAYEEAFSIFRSGSNALLVQADGDTRNLYSTAFSRQWSCPNWFSTSSGHIGRSLAVPQTGDVVAVFNGAATPFLLRPVHGQETYEFMGEAYAHGVMQGEALLEENRGKHPKKTFELV